ncbi:MAG TPA: agmatinase family protein [Chitinophagales bacterium]|nr:agmatinase family protein [Chitinophagales bacterium]
MSSTNPTKADKIKSFDPSSPAGGDGIFGLPFTQDESDLVLVPVPWEVTVSYNPGTEAAPEAIMDASKQVDLYEPLYPNAWHHGIFMQKTDKWISKVSKEMRPLAVEYIDAFVDGKAEKKHNQETLERINEAGLALREHLRKTTGALLDAGHVVGLVGGDHSTPLGFIEAVGERYRSFGILQIDAHMDLRKAYEGFTYSHASVMYNALQLPAVNALVQVGIRDFSDEEMMRINELRAAGKTIEIFYDARMKKRLYEGASWKQICDGIIDLLPPQVYISFDIDGLDPKLCPHTGTPVPGGLEFEQVVYLIDQLVERGIDIVGFDLNEVSPGKDEWDANVGARMLYKMCALALRSRHQRPDVLKDGKDPVQHHRRQGIDVRDKEAAD